MGWFVDGGGGGGSWGAYGPKVGSEGNSAGNPHTGLGPTLCSWHHMALVADGASYAGRYYDLYQNGIKLVANTVSGQAGGTHVSADYSSDGSKTFFLGAHTATTRYGSHHYQTEHMLLQEHKPPRFYLGNPVSYTHLRANETLR